MPQSDENYEMESKNLLYVTLRRNLWFVIYIKHFLSNKSEEIDILNFENLIYVHLDVRYRKKFVFRISKKYLIFYDLKEHLKIYIWKKYLIFDKSEIHIIWCLSKKTLCNLHIEGSADI